MSRSQPARGCPGPISRRALLRFGLAGLGGLSLPELFRQRAVAASDSTSQRTAVILVWLPGGPSHLETWDPKPLAPSEYRGPYSPVSTSVPGMQICELLPRQAQIADKLTILRSMVHTGFCHQQGTQQLVTGHPVLELKQKPDHPDFLSITHRLRLDRSRSLPNYVGVPAANYFGAAYLGPAYEPFTVTGDPNAPEFHVPNIGLTDAERAVRLRGRLDLRQKFDRLRREIDHRGDMQALDEFEGQAWNLLTSPAAREAFDIAREDPRIRDGYGRHRWGQQCLLARRLVEAGVELMTVQFDGALCGRVGNWDDHAVNHNVFEAMKYRAPFLDQAVTALIEDLFARGLDRRVMVVVGGEFGRTPRISYVASSGEGTASAPAGTVQPGRDHWPRATSLLFAGGGIAGGQVVGATDVRGEDAIDRIVRPGDFLATMYRHLAIDAEQVAFADFAGRPIPILPRGGQPIPELTQAGDRRA